MRGRPTVWLALGPFVLGCVFVPPPPLPEELAAQEAEEAARLAAAAGEKGRDPAAAQGEAGGGTPRFADGDPPELGMTLEEMKAYAVAQGDPTGGEFLLEEAVADLPGEGPLWAVLHTTAGIIDCELFAEATPLTVANFVGLARGLRPTRDPATREWVQIPFYDGSEFHRVIEGFMIQGGDRTGTGMGSTGYVIPDEFSSVLRHDRAGRLSMANRGPGTGSGQFFVTLAPTPHLDDKHTIFGQCSDDAIEVAEAIAATRGPGDRPRTLQVIEKIEIVRRPAAS